MATGAGSEVRVGMPLTQEQVRVMAGGKSARGGEEMGPEQDPELVPLVTKTVEEREAWVDALKAMHGIQPSAQGRWGRGWWCFWSDPAATSVAVRRTALGRRTLSSRGGVEGGADEDEEEVVVNATMGPHAMPAPPVHETGKENPETKDQMIGYQGTFFDHDLPAVPEWVPMHLVPETKVLREYIDDVLAKRRCDPATGEIIGMSKEEWEAIADPDERAEKKHRVFAMDWDRDLKEFFETFMWDDVEEDPRELEEMLARDPYLRNPAIMGDLDITGMLAKMAKEDMGQFPPSESPRTSLVVPAPDGDGSPAAVTSARDAGSDPRHDQREGAASPGAIKRSSTQRSAAASTLSTSSSLRRDSIGVVVPPALHRNLVLAAHKSSVDAAWVSSNGLCCSSPSPKDKGPSVVERGWYGPSSVVTAEDSAEARRFFLAFLVAFVLLRVVSIAINEDFEFLALGTLGGDWIDVHLLVSVATMWAVITVFDLALAWCMKRWGMADWFVRKMAKFNHLFVPIVTRVVYRSQCKEPTTDLLHRFFWGMLYTYLPSLKAVRRADGLGALTTPLQTVHLCRWAVLKNVADPFTLWHPFAEHCGSAALVIAIELLATHAFGAAKPQAWSLLALSVEFWADGLASILGRLIAGNPVHWNLQRADIYGMPQPPSTLERALNATAFRIRSLYTSTGEWLGFEPEGDDGLPVVDLAGGPSSATGEAAGTDRLKGDLKRDARRTSFLDSYGPTPAHDAAGRRSSIPAFRGGGDGNGDSTPELDPPVTPVDPTLRPQGTPRRTPIGCLVFFATAYLCVFLQIDSVGASRFAVARLAIPALATVAEALSPARFDGIFILLATLVGMVVTCTVAAEDPPAFSFPNRFDDMVYVGAEPAWWRYQNNITMMDGYHYRWNATHCGEEEQFPWLGTLGKTLDPACFARVPQEEIPVWPREPKIATYPFA